MISIPSSNRHSVSCMKDLKNLLKNQAHNPLTTLASPSTAALQYFNMRVTQRLHRYRSMKRQWQEVATSNQRIASLSPTCGSSALLPNIPLVTQDSIKNSTVTTQKSVIELKINETNVVPTVKETNERHLIELDPLHSRIQQDLIKLRRLIKKRERKFNDDNQPFIISSPRRSLGETTSIPTAFDDQDKIIRKASSLNNLKPLDRVKISGCQMRSSTLPKSDSTDSGIGSTSNSSSTCSQYPKQQQKSTRQNNSKTFNICRSRVEPLPPPPPLSSDSSHNRASHLSKKKSNTSSKMTQSVRSKQTLPSRLSLLVPQIPTVGKKKQPSFIKQEIRSPLIRRSSISGDITTRLYTYAASSSSATPRSMILKRNTSLLPILLQSSSCIGLQSSKVHLHKPEYGLDDESQEKKNNDDMNDDDYYRLLDYKDFLNHLPKSVISLHPRCEQDDYGIVFNQLAHIRKRMPDSNTYEEYARST